MIPDTPFSRTVIHTLSILQSAIAPIAFLHYVYYIATETHLISLHPIIDTILHYWLGSELIFYVYFQMTVNRMQQLIPPVCPTYKERQALYHNCIENVQDMYDFLLGWFVYRNNPTQHPTFDELQRENLAEWVSWGFFSLPLHELQQDASLSAEMYSMIDSLASKLDIRLKSGYNDALRSCRLTLDPMVTYHRPLVIYVTIYVLTKIFHYVLQMWGMTRYSPEMPSSLAIFRDSPSSWQTKLQGKQPEKITYWFRDGDRLNKRPIVFIHGLGAGLMCYAGFLRTLLDLEAPIFCIELPHVAMRFTEDAPSAEDTVRDIERMLHRHDFQDAVFIAHSLGTAVTAWALKLIPKCISGVIMLDSICFMLHYKDVCGNFVYRMPTTASQFIIKYFASSELYISYYISRHFHWFKAALYVTPPECNDPSMTWMTTRLPANTKIYLSEKDSIVNSPLVASYLQGRKVECEVMKGLEHATFLFQPYWKQRIVETLEKFILVN